MMTMNLKITGMSCSHCEKRVADALWKIGITDVVVSAKSGSATVTFDEVRVSVPKLRQAVHDVGYEVTDASLAPGAAYVPGKRPACCEPPERHP